MFETEQPSDTPPASRISGLLAPLIGNIWSGCRLALFRPVRVEEFRADANLVAQALLALAAVNFLLAYTISLPNPAFNAYGIATLAMGVMVTAAGIWAMALVRRATPFVPRLLVIVASATIPLNAVIFAAYATARHLTPPAERSVVLWSVFAAGAFWSLMIAIRAQRAVLGPGSWKSLMSASVYLSVVLVPAFALPQVPAWVPHYEESKATDSEDDYVPVDAERTFYAQPALLAEALGNVADQRPGVTDLYFLGFAGYGRQDVFMKEVQAAASLFGSRFDTEGHSLSLINNPATADRTPIASVTNLRLALAGMAQKMDPNEDVLFLFLTSHGSPSELAVQFWPLPLNDLTPGDLRQALDDAGIRWRAIVVSACYSGSFIDDLRDPGTLVITAARKDRTSFGCSDDADFTYFGRALVDQALRETYSFTDAFARAYASVSERETAEHNTPSEPQIFIGESISAKLAEIETRLLTQSQVAAQH